MTTASVRTTSTAARLGLAALAAAAVNALIALVASRLDDGGIGMGLTPASYLPATVAGILIGFAGWTLISRRAPGALRWAVPAALVVTWIPDALLLNAGATAANVAGLMLMHLVVATAVVTALRTRTARVTA